MLKISLMSDSEHLSSIILGSWAWEGSVYGKKNLHWIKTAILDQENGPENILCHRESLELLSFHYHRVLGKYQVA